MQNMALKIPLKCGSIIYVSSLYNWEIILPRSLWTNGYALTASSLIDPDTKAACHLPLLSAHNSF